MKYYNSERESHLQWSDYVSGSWEPMLWLCSFKLELTEGDFPECWSSVSSSPKAALRPPTLLTTFPSQCFCDSKLKRMFQAV